MAKAKKRKSVRSRSKIRSRASGARASKVNGNGSGNGNGNGNGLGVDASHEKRTRARHGNVMTVTFRIPVNLKKGIEEDAKHLGMTTTRWMVEAAEDKLEGKPPRWWKGAPPPEWIEARDRSS
jgi:hypothetical protein